MRILQVSSPLQLGGGETHVIELTEALRQRGHDVVVAGRPGSAVKPDVELPFRNAIDLGTIRRLRELMKAKSFDIVHAHVARDYPLVLAAARRLPTKVVLTRHLLYPVRSNFLYKRVDGWIAPTTQILTTLARLKPRASAVIPNWVDLEKFPFRPHALNAPVTLGLLGQISPHKGHEQAIEAMRRLQSNHRLVIAGKGEEGYVSELRAKCAGLPVEFVGFVTLPEFFDAIDVLLVPSWEEPFGIVVLEGMASGIPVIATAAGGPLDIIQSGIDGILVPPRDPNALVSAILSIPEARDKLIRAARQRAQDFDIRSVVPRIEAFYRTL
ncbi:MAG TPA: glycosyltransferase family 4 protein [Terriglobia bacterium]|nr:glycosyltransferase family 4 protein [Terriglobia bacterium]